MKVTLGKEGLDKTWQYEFPEIIDCCKCGSQSLIGFVAHEGIDDDDKAIFPREHVQFICDLPQRGVPQNETQKLWLHDCCSVAVYFCEECLTPTALSNQA